jgi:hypothetical protein
MRHVQASPFYGWIPHAFAVPPPRLHLKLRGDIFARFFGKLAAARSLPATMIFLLEQS